MVNILAYLAATKIAADLVSRSQKARMLKRDSSSPWISAHDSLFPICIYLVSQKVKQVSAQEVDAEFLFYGPEACEKQKA